LKVAAAITGLAVGEYLKTAANEYVKVTALADSGLTLTITRNGAPCGLTQAAAAAAAAGETVTLYEGGIDNDDTSLKIYPALTGLDVNEYVKTEAGEYLAVSAISTASSISTLTISRNAAPLGLTQGAAAAAVAGEDVTLAAMNDDGFHPNDSTGANLAQAKLGAGVSASELECGCAHTCIRTSAGSTKCWGLNSKGQLGQASTDNLGDQGGEMASNLAAINWGTGRTVTDIAAGSAHTCALLDNDQVKCVGYGGEGALGYEATADKGKANQNSGNNVPPVDLGTGKSICPL
jgi:hypothetical protein